MIPTRCRDPIFIVGTERSGSNLLRLMLDRHPAIVVPHPPHEVRYFTPLLPLYDLATEAGFRRLARDVVRLVRLHISPWDLSVDPDDLAARADPRTLFGLSVALYETCRSASGKRRWGSKSTFLIHHADEILGTFPAAKLLLLVRDPRDVAASSKRSVFNPYHPYFTARLWRAQQAVGIELLGRLGPGGIRLVRYEDLVRDPETELRRICAFLGEDFEPAMLRCHETAEAVRLASLSASWRNSARPVLAGNAGKYRRELRPGETRLVEAIARVEMQRLGYALENGGESLGALDPDRRRWLYRLLDVAGTLRIELLSLFRDRNCLRRWSRAAFLEWLRLRLRAARAFRPASTG